ncbi:MAG: putative ABC transport system ATP-binding protein [Cellvibrionaceae bacterium]|jgi:putative ABC transport system ATP-binding protein
MTNAISEKVAAVKATHLRRVYHSAGREVEALKSISLEIPVGRFIAAKGKSGSGKTTLLNCLGGLDTPTSGEILIHGRSIEQMSEDERTNWRQKEVGFIFQAFGLLPTLSTYENIELMLRIAGFPRSERRSRTLEVINMVGLDKWTNHRPFEMSGGQQQRVAVARALANRPSLILADEATGELDTQTSHEILTLLKNIVSEENVTILLATHDDLVDGYADQVLRLSDGKII